MNILIINQPLNNRGDESAHKAFVRALSSTLPQAHIKVLFFDNNDDSIRQFSVMLDNVEYINLRHVRGYGHVTLPVLKNGRFWLWHLHPTTRKLLKFYHEADWVVCAPGGICMGGFQDWWHLFFLRMAQYTKKHLAYYGRSFGPFPSETTDNKIFKEISLSLLRYFSFLSVRDAKSAKLAEELQIPYIPTVDTAFLDSPKSDIPKEIAAKIGSGKYVVFVPNLLVWHYAYRHVEKEKVIRFFSMIFKEIVTKYNQHKVVLLPQTFNYKNPVDNDVNFFLELEAEIADPRIVVINDKYSSDIQQTLISGADCMIGARYHSVVFAINNSVPFVALSYEHKIAGLLENLGGERFMVDINHSFDSDESMAITVTQFRTVLNDLHIDSTLQSSAKKIASTCFKQFITIVS